MFGPDETQWNRVFDIDFILSKWHRYIQLNNFGSHAMNVVANYVSIAFRIPLYFKSVNSRSENRRTNE